MVVGWSVRAYGEVYEALPAKDDRMSKLHQRQAAVVEIEAVINSWRLSYVSATDI